MKSTLLIQSLILASVFNTNLITKTDFDVKLSSLNIKITSNKIKHLLVENELKKLKTFDLSYFISPGKHLQSTIFTLMKMVYNII